MMVISKVFVRFDAELAHCLRDALPVRFPHEFPDSSALFFTQPRIGRDDGIICAVGNRGLTHAASLVAGP